MHLARCWVILWTPTRMPLCACTGTHRTYYKRKDSNSDWLTLIVFKQGIAVCDVHWIPTATVWCAIRAQPQRTTGKTNIKVRSYFLSLIRAHTIYAAHVRTAQHTKPFKSKPRTECSFRKPFPAFAARRALQCGKLLLMQVKPLAPRPASERNFVRIDQRKEKNSGQYYLRKFDGVRVTRIIKSSRRLVSRSSLLNWIMCCILRYPFSSNELTHFVRFVRFQCGIAFKSSNVSVRHTHAHSVAKSFQLYGKWKIRKMNSNESKNEIHDLFRFTRKLGRRARPFVSSLVSHHIQTTITKGKTWFFEETSRCVHVCAFLFLFFLFCLFFRHKETN